MIPKSGNRFSEKIMLKQQSRPGIADCRRIVNRQRRQAAAAIWPQSAGSATAYTLYSFECCVRSAAVLGFVGAGGIGAEINLSMRLFEYGQVTTLLLTFIVLVLAVDAFSRTMRGRFRRSGLHGSGVHAWRGRKDGPSWSKLRFRR